MRCNGPFSIIVEDFDEELKSLRELVEIGTVKSASAKTRVAAVHATTLMLAAAFAEFVQEMAREYAMQIVHSACNLSDLPDAILETAWKRTFQDLVRSKASGSSKREWLGLAAKRTRPTIDALCAFIEGDITRYCFAHLIRSDRNMRVIEINKLFKVSGLADICSKSCEQTSLREFFQQEDVGKSCSEFHAALEHFVNRRNEVAHSLNATISSAPDVVSRDIEMFRAFSKDLGTTLEAAIGQRSRH